MSVLDEKKKGSSALREVRTMKLLNGLKNSPMLQVFNSIYCVCCAIFEHYLHGKSFIRQCKREKANQSVPIIKRYSLLTPKVNESTNINSELYGENGRHHFKLSKKHQLQSAEYLHNGSSSLIIQEDMNSRNVSVERDTLGLSKEEKIFFRKVYDTKQRYPRRFPSLIEEKREVYLHDAMKKKQLLLEISKKSTKLPRKDYNPGDPSHDTFPLLFPVRSMNVAL